MRNTVAAAAVAVVLGLGVGPARADEAAGWAGTWEVVGQTTPRELVAGPDGRLRLEWIDAHAGPAWAEGPAERPGRLALEGARAPVAAGLVAAVSSAAALDRPGSIQVELLRLADEGDGVERATVTLRRDLGPVTRERWVRRTRPALRLEGATVGRSGPRERPLDARGWRPGRDGPLTLVVRVLGAPQRLALVVRDARGAPLRALGGEALLAPGLHRLGWDGRVGPEPGARVVSAGDYTLVVDSPELHAALGEDAAPLTTRVSVGRARP